MFLHVILSRLIILVIQVCANSVIPDHDAQAFKHLEMDLEKSPSGKTIRKVFAGFLRWDAQYFFHIAKYGYTFENTLAFFPMFPESVKFFARVLHAWLPFMNEDSWLSLVFMYMNFLSFFFAVIFLFWLTANVLNNYDLAYKATIFFCYNPASIFFSAPYTEAMYSFFSIFGMFMCFQFYSKYSQIFSVKYWNLFWMLLMFSAATFTRSNGILNCGFVAFYAVKLYTNRVGYSSKEKYWTAMIYASFTFILCAIIVFPFVLFQIYSYVRFCKDFEPKLPESIIKMAHENNFVLPGNVSHYNQSWCFDTIPLAYSYVQSHYWNVGFLKYYEFKQIPNFLLATPIVVIILYYSSVFFKQHYRNLFSYIFVANHQFSRRNLDQNENFRIDMFPFVVHAVFLTVFNVLTINVQVTTRILCSASPVLYWYCAYLFRNVPSDDFSFLWQWRCEKKQILMKLYFISYFFVGTVMFCNFLPWT